MFIKKTRSTCWLARMLARSLACSLAYLLAYSFAPELAVQILQFVLPLLRITVHRHSVHQRQYAIALMGHSISHY